MDNVRDHTKPTSELLKKAQDLLENNRDVTKDEGAHQHYLKLRQNNSELKVRFEGVSLYDIL